MMVSPRSWIAASAWLVCAILPGACARDGAAPPPGRLQLYIMPDTQAWAWNQGRTTLETWRSVVRKLCEQRSRFAMVLHTGDLVDYPRAHPYEWSNAQSVMKQLDACEMPYAIAFGNHDFDNYPPNPGEALKGDQSWKKVMAELAHRPIETAPSGRTALHPLAPGWVVLTVDFRPSAADLGWIAAEIAERRGARFVLLSHACMKASGIADGWCRELVERHPEIRIAVSGHWLGSAREGWNEIVRANGQKLIALYQNYQHVPALAAWGVVVELDPVSGDLCVWSEDLLTGAVTRPPASSSAVGEVAAGFGRRCFKGS